MGSKKNTKSSKKTPAAPAAAPSGIKKSHKKKTPTGPPTAPTRKSSRVASRAAVAQPEATFAQPEPAFAPPEPAFAQPEPAFPQPEPALPQPEPAIDNSGVKNHPSIIEGLEKERVDSDSDLLSELSESGFTDLEVPLAPAPIPAVPAQIPTQKLKLKLNSKSVFGDLEEPLVLASTPAIPARSSTQKPTLKLKSKSVSFASPVVSHQKSPEVSESPRNAANASIDSAPAAAESVKETKGADAHKVRKAAPNIKTEPSSAAGLQPPSTSLHKVGPVRTSKLNERTRPPRTARTSQLTGKARPPRNALASKTSTPIDLTEDAESDDDETCSFRTSRYHRWSKTCRSHNLNQAPSPKPRVRNPVSRAKPTSWTGKGRANESYPGRFPNSATKDDFGVGDGRRVSRSDGVNRGSRLSSAYEVNDTFGFSSGGYAMDNSRDRNRSSTFDSGYTIDNTSAFSSAYTMDNTSAFSSGYTMDNTSAFTSGYTMDSSSAFSSGHTMNNPSRMPGSSTTDNSSGQNRSSTFTSDHTTHNPSSTNTNSIFSSNYTMHNPSTTTTTSLTADDPVSPTSPAVPPQSLFEAHYLIQSWGSGAHIAELDALLSAPDTARLFYDLRRHVAARIVDERAKGVCGHGDGPGDANGYGGVAQRCWYCVERPVRRVAAAWVESRFGEWRAARVESARRVLEGR